MAQVPLRELHLYDTRLEPKGIPYFSPTLECIYVDTLSPGCVDLLGGKFPALRLLQCKAMDLTIGRISQDVGSTIYDK